LGSYDSAPRPPLPPRPREQIVSLSQSACVSSPVDLTDGRVGSEGSGRGAKSYDTKKAFPSINHSILIFLTLGVEGK
jgi:hypothetical protein